MKLQPAHIGISVADLRESVGWYEDILGFRLENLEGFDDLRAKVATMRQGDFCIELFEHWDSLPLPHERMQPREDLRTQGTKHICFAVEDIGALFRHFHRQGVDVVMEPRPERKRIIGFVHDPSGVLLEFMEPVAEDVRPAPAQQHNISTSRL